MSIHDIIGLQMSEQEQEDVIKKLREKVVKINTNKPSSPHKVEEQEVKDNAKKAGETIDDDSVPPANS